MFLREEARSSGNLHHFLHMAALKDESSLAKMLLKCGAPIDGKDERGQTALSYAVSQGFENTAKVLLEAGASVDSNMFVTPLHTASQRGNADVAKQLLHHKANVNAKDKQSKSPLHFACERGDKTMVEMLLNANADPSAQDKEKKTPLHAAVLRGHLSIVQVLLPHTAAPGWTWELSQPIPQLHLDRGEKQGYRHSVPGRTLLSHLCSIRCRTALTRNYQHGTVQDHRIAKAGKGA
uniref:Uncharacterized protein n=1 Tax=Phasianus colchicus TaxID=9054 RepID=A0A669PWG9_PHACC